MCSEAKWMWKDQPGTITEVKSLHYTSQKRPMQGAYSGAYKTFSLGFEHIKANVQNLIFYFIKCSLLLHLIGLYS